MKANQATRGALNLARSYNFVDKADVVDEIRTTLEDSGMTLKGVAVEADVSPGTLLNWFAGKTKKPQKTTLDKVAGVFGKRVGLVDLPEAASSPAPKGNVVPLSRARLRLQAWRWRR